MKITHTTKVVTSLLMHNGVNYSLI